MYCWYQASRGYGSVGVRCVHCITSSRYLCPDTRSVQVDEPPGEALRHPLLSSLLISRSFLLHQSPNRTLSIPGNIVVIYVVVCSCPRSSRLVFRSSISLFFSIFLLPTYFHNPDLPKWLPYTRFQSCYFLEAMPCTLGFFFHARYSLTMS